MSVLERLSSAAGDPSEASNKAVAREALERPEILDEVAVGLEWDDRKLVGDCAEVFTEVAKENPAGVRYCCQLWNTSQSSVRPSCITTTRAICPTIGT